MMTSCLVVARLALSATAVVTAHSPAAAPPVCKVFILAGQSNMEGQGVVDLMDKDHNDGRGTLTALATDPRTAGLIDGHLEDGVHVAIHPIAHRFGHSRDLTHPASRRDVDVRDIRVARLTEPRRDDDAVFIGDDADWSPRGAHRGHHEW